MNDEALEHRLWKALERLDATDPRRSNDERVRAVLAEIAAAGYRLVKVGEGDGDEEPVVVTLPAWMWRHVITAVHDDYERPDKPMRISLDQIERMIRAQVGGAS